MSAHAQADTTRPASTGGAATAPAGVGFAYGIVLDSLHGFRLPGALVRVEGTNREAFSDSTGLYRLDSIPAGRHRMQVMHPLLDTLGISLVTPLVSFTAGQALEINLAIPSGETLIDVFCTAARRNLGPGALVGNVREADSDAPAVGAKVSLLFYESDPLGFKKTPRVREATIGEDGRYRICGLPDGMSGKLQVFLNGVSSGEVPVDLGDRLLGLRSMSISTRARVVAQAPADSGKRTTNVLRGRSRVAGTILNKYGQPITGARVGVQGTGMATLTRANGAFSLDSLPAGTQTLEVRQLGYAPTEVAVELSASEPQQVSVKMSDYVPVLQSMRVTAERDRGLSDVGFAQRKRSGLGYYLDADALATRPSSQFSDLLRTVPGIRVVPAGNNTNVIQSSRGMGGCVVFYVDGSQWTQQYPGDLDSFVRPEEIAALEVYNSSTVPAQFQMAGNSSCTTVVVWTERRINRKK